ncbi:CAP domain-containing protein [Streptomyces sp. A7024]|uniref:CAP domain-containing protein n=1 Tax=Streptomyces coryli TaxID=1128680 RepID=A0A6G4U654_9ACTN|nr:CAP domain-containing protein [Streptomyces coryli]NGN66868.1 CAP domain-containing protein [Streptomyces coryli]
MGRHRRSADEPAAVPTPRTGERGQHRKQSAARAGMLGASAAVAVGALAMGSGLLGSNFDLAPSGGDGKVTAGGGAKPSLESQQIDPDDVEPRGSESASREDSRSPLPSSSSPSEKKTSEKPSAPSSSSKPTDSEESKSSTPTRTPSEKPSTKAPAPEPTKSASKTPSATTSAEQTVLTLVNQERAKAGCQPVKLDPALASLAGGFSEDMANRDFFDHTDPDGDDPWDRAEAAGVDNLGGENIARGQANAQSVMDSWMQSEGHKANILNCDFKTLGVGAYFADGGPWWTQSFGY